MHKLDWARPALVGVLAASGTIAIALGAGAVLAASSPTPSPATAQNAPAGPRGGVTQADLTILAKDGSTKEIRVAHGQITTLDGSSISVSLATGGTDTFAIDTNTVFRAQGKVVTAGDFAVGDQVVIEASQSGDGYTANLVRAAPTIRDQAPGAGPDGPQAGHPRIDRFLDRHPFLGGRMGPGGPAGEPTPSVAP